MGALESRDGNNADFLRFLAALLVIAGHGLPLLGRSYATDPVAWLVGIDTVAGVAVGVFFCLSGYLVTASFERCNQLQDYLVKRCRRIFPGLIVCVALSVFVLGPALTTLGPEAYFARGETWVYFKNIYLHHQLALPGVFERLPVPGVNGSLWSLFAEFMMYLLVPGLFVLGLLNAQCVATICLILAFKLWSDIDVLAKASLFNLVPAYATLRTAFMFFAGCYVYLMRGRFRFSSHIALALLAALFILRGTREQQVAYLIAVPYLTFWLTCVRLPEWIRNFGRRGDFSYGLYLYGFPIQQCVITLWLHQTGHMPNVFSLTLVSTLLAFLIAVLSWHLIERPALRLELPGWLRDTRPKLT